MKKIVFIWFLTFVFVACAQSKHERIIAFYNVENLYDTINDPVKNDEQFLPEGEYKWTSERYNDHIKKIAHVMDDMGTILAMGVAEIENKTVLQDVLKQRKNNKLGIVHYDSPDERGVDVGLFYDTTLLTLQNSGFIRFKTVTTDITTRDIVWAKFFYKNQSIYFLVNHWPSRRGGEESSEPNRLKAAGLATNFMDSITKLEPTTSFVFMGDLNDYPQDKAPQLIAKKLTPMISKASGEFGGSYNYRGEWDVLDHIMVSSNLFTAKKLKVIQNSGKIFSPTYLIEEYKGQKVPFRVYAGAKYLGGYSDHFPVKINVKLK
jgi:hypothetical protein